MSHQTFIPQHRLTGRNGAWIIFILGLVFGRAQHAPRETGESV